MYQRIKKLTKVNNFRDFGHYPTKDGAMVRKDCLFRSGHFADADDADNTYLDGLDIRLQVDLRRVDERERQPHLWPKTSSGGDGMSHDNASFVLPGFTLLTTDGGREETPAHIAFLQQDDITAQSVNGYMTNYYRRIPYEPHYIALFARWFAHLEITQGAVLINCAAGKDRTGILAGLTLSLLGVEEAHIIEDYMLTNEAVQLEKRLPLIAKYFDEFLGKTLDHELYRPFLGVDAGYLSAAFDTMRQKDGSISNYMQTHLGLNAKRIDTLKQKFLA